MSLVSPRPAAFALCLVAALPFSAHAMEGMEPPDPSEANFEVKYLTHMNHHHAMGVASSNLCAERAVHAELKALCETMAMAQHHEMMQIQSWLHHWYMVHQHHVELSDKDQREMDALRALTGADFEIAFLDMMITHHASAVRSSEKCLRKAHHPELIDFCANIVSTQQAEIDQMDAWQEAWYGIVD